MTKTTLTPQLHHVFNELDHHGVFLGLKRLEGERNAQFKCRLLDVFVNKPNSTYRGLINAITRELGYSITETIKVSSVLSGGEVLYPNSVIEFKDTKCYLYEDYTTGTPTLSLDRFDTDSSSYTVSGLISNINDSGIFTVEGLEYDNDQRALTIFNQSTLGIITSEDISSQGIKVNLAHKRAIPGTVFFTSSNLYNEVLAEGLVRRPGDYYIDYINGIIVTGSVPVPGSYIRYQYHQNPCTFLSSPVILHNIQSDDFKTKMFEQVLQEDGTYANGLPTPYGADIVNGILSVHPANWGK